MYRHAIPTGRDPMPLECMEECEEAYSDSGRMDDIDAAVDTSME